MSGHQGGGGQRQWWQGRVSGVHWSPLSARGGWGQCVRRECWCAVLQRWPQSTAHHSAVVLVFCGGLSFSKSIPGCGAPRCHPLRLFPRSQQQSPSQTCSSLCPCSHWRTPISGWGAQGCGLGHLCGFPSVLPTSDWVLLSPSSPQAFLQSQLMALLVRGFPRCGALF